MQKISMLAFYEKKRMQFDAHLCLSSRTEKPMMTEDLYSCFPMFECTNTNVHSLWSYQPSVQKQLHKPRNIIWHNIPFGSEATCTKSVSPKSPGVTNTPSFL